MRYRPAAQNAFDQIHQLVSRELIPFDVRYKFSLAVDHYSVQGMIHQTFVGKEIHAEHPRHAPHFR